MDDGAGCCLARLHSASHRLPALHMNAMQAAAGAIASGIIFVLYHLANYCRNQKVAVAIPDDIESAQEDKGVSPATK